MPASLARQAINLFRRLEHPMEDLAHQGLGNSRFHPHRFSLRMLKTADNLISERLSDKTVLLHPCQAILDPSWEGPIALGSEAQGVFDDPRHLRHSGYGQSGTADVQRFQGIDLPATFDAQNVFERYADCLERQFVRGRAPLAQLG